MDYDFQTPEAELDKRLAVKFYKKAVRNNFKSKQEGREVYENEEYISIRIPGDNTSVVDRPTTDADKKRFAVIWERYLNKEDDLTNGTPIDLLPTLNPAQRENLKSHRVYTIEQLAGLQEGVIVKILGSRQMVADAKKFLEGDSYAKKLEQELQELRSKLAKLEEKQDEPSDNHTERSGRDGAGGQPSKRGRKPRQVREEVSGAGNESGKGVAVETRVASSH